MVPDVNPVNVAETAAAVVPLSDEGVAATVGGESLSIRTLSLSATKTSPAASTATPAGKLYPEPMVLIVPLGSTRLMARLPESATKTSPAPLTATPAAG